MSKYAQSRQFFVMFRDSILRRKLPAYFLLTEYMDIIQKQIVSTLFVCYFYNITIAIMSDNRETEIMLYFTDEVF